jgi:hypothetical protein
LDQRDCAGNYRVGISKTLFHHLISAVFYRVPTAAKKSGMCALHRFQLHALDRDAVAEDPTVAVKDQRLSGLGFLTPGELNRDFTAAKLGQTRGRFDNLINSYNCRLVVNRDAFHICAFSLLHGALKNKGRDFWFLR